MSSWKIAGPFDRVRKWIDNVPEGLPESPPVRGPDPNVQPEGWENTYEQKEKPIIYPQIPNDGLPFFITPDGEIIVDGPGSSHAQMKAQILRPRGLDRSLGLDYEKWGHGRLFPTGLEDYNKELTPEEQQRLMEAFAPYLHTSKVADTSIPAQYTPEDPLDLQGKQPVFEAMDTQWWTLPVEEGKRAVINAFRATMLSPRMNLKGNAVLYQLLMNVDPNESNPDVFESIIRDTKEQWDAQGQTDIYSDPEDSPDQSQFLPGRLQPGIWTNIRRVAALGPYADELYKAAIADIQNGGTGEIFRNRILQLRIPGVGAKVSSFAWLALAPMTSELGTIDVHMMRHLNEEGDSPRNTKHYFELEQQLRNERDQNYPDTPLTQYQWGVWDKRRTPGFHQDHSPLRPVDPTPYTDIHWAPQPRPPRPQRLPEPDPNQLGFQFGKWKKLAGYSLQGQIVSQAPQAQTEGIAVRPDVQSRQEIQQILDTLPGHEHDQQKQRSLIPEWSINRGGKVADWRQGPSDNFTYAPGVIIVREWVDVEDNWILYHDRCVGIIAGKGGATSHGVVVARERNIPIVVNVQDWNSINQGDQLTIDGTTGIIHGNGGSTQQFEQAQEALEPVIAFVWSEGNGLYQPIPAGSGGAAILHRPMIRQLKHQQLFNPLDYAIGVIYADGKVQMQGTPTDQQEMQTWLNTIGQKNNELEPAPTA